MNSISKEKEFERSVKNKFNVYNSLFLNLPFRSISNIGMLIPLMQTIFKRELDSGSDPLTIMDSFLTTHADLKTEEQKIDFMFRVIQYIERQIVLYDSIEDAAFPQILKLEDSLTLKDYINLSDTTKTQAGIYQTLSNFSIRIVFTAHPTQFYSPPVLDIIAKLRNLITENDIPGMDLTLQQLGLTSLVNVKKPTPLDEAKNIIYFLRSVYYDAAGELYNEIKSSVPDRNFDNTNIIQLGFWPGGDRDGNPYVTSDTTAAAADELRMTLMKCYYRDVKDLSKKLTFRDIQGSISGLAAKLSASRFNPDEAIKYEEIINPLNAVRESLIKKYNSLYLEELDSLIDKVRIFKTHFASLDIRQNHSVHKKTIEEILKKQKSVSQSPDKFSRKQLISILTHKRFRINPDQYEDKLINDTIKTIKQLKHIQEKNGEDGCCRFVISNSEDIFSVLFVFALLRWCGWSEGKIPFDIIPLFESMEGMKNSEFIMKELFEIPEYRQHIKNRRNRQTIMLGFSDGTKDGGYLQANWSIFKTKETLTSVCREYSIEAIFFDGRGGPPARGGGKTHRFYAAQGPRIANHAIQLTIQGQTITSKYGTKEHFINNCEQLITAGLHNSLFAGENSISDESRELIETLAQISYEKYNELKNHKMFVPYLENKSTLKYYGRTNIGSRPAKRGTKKRLDLSDLRAIPFVGSWSQLKQNVPGYFGVGTAIRILVDKGKLNKLKKLFKEAVYFKALILNSMMSLSKCNFELTDYIKKDREYGEFWNILYEEYKLSIEMTLLISGYSTLMEEDPVTKESIKIREQIVLPLLVIQQYALQKIEQNISDAGTYEKIVQRSLYGNINASRNSA